MNRITNIVNITLQFTNPVQKNQIDADVVTTLVDVMLDENSNLVMQPHYYNQVTIPTDITEEVLEAIKIKFKQIGLDVKRIEDANTTK